MDRSQVVLAIGMTGLDGCIDGTTHPAVGFGGDEDDDWKMPGKPGGCSTRQYNSEVGAFLGAGKRKGKSGKNQGSGTNSEWQTPDTGESEGFKSTFGDGGLAWAAVESTRHLA